MEDRLCCLNGEDQRYTHCSRRNLLRFIVAQLALGLNGRQEHLTPGGNAALDIFEVSIDDLPRLHKQRRTLRGSDADDFSVA